MERIAICRRKYDANVKNVIAKRSSKLNQSDYSDRPLRDKKAQHFHLGRNRWQTLSSQLFLVNMTLKLSLRVATH